MSSGAAASRSRTSYGTTLQCSIHSPCFRRKRFYAISEHFTSMMNNLAHILHSCTSIRVEAIKLEVSIHTQLSEDKMLLVLAFADSPRLSYVCLTTGFLCGIGRFGASILHDTIVIVADGGNSQSVFLLVNDGLFAFSLMSALALFTGISQYVFSCPPLFISAYIVSVGILSNPPLRSKMCGRTLRVQGFKKFLADGACLSVVTRGCSTIVRRS